MTICPLFAPTERPLERAELMALVRDVAAHPEWWEHRLDANAGTRTYEALHRDAHVDLWAIAWYPQSDTGWHDHDTSSGAVHVVRGELVESVLRIGRAEAHCGYGAGSGFSFAPTHIHRLACESGRAVSIHAYSPPLPPRRPLRHPHHGASPAATTRGKTLPARGWPRGQAR